MKNYEKKIKKTSQESDKNFVCGRNATLLALENDKDQNLSFDTLYIDDSSAKNSMKDIIGKAKSQNIQVRYVDKNKLNTLTNTTRHQGVALSLSEVKFYEIEDLAQNTEENRLFPFIIMLDEIEDCFNLGSALRVADCCGANGIIVKEKRSAPFNAHTSKASAGAISSVKVARVTNLANAVEKLKELGFFIVSTTLDGTDYTKAKFDMPICLIIGNEHKGVSRLLIDKSDMKVNIKMRGKCDSLNASVSLGVLAFEINKQQYNSTN